jgi:hypothetical protein
VSDIFPIDDPTECRHPFDLLSTTLERELVCEGCGGAWPTADADALEVLFLAAADKAAEQDDRLDRLEGFITQNFGAAGCSACGGWIDADEPLTGGRIAGMWACVQHLSVAAAYVDTPAAKEEALEWAERAGLLLSRDLEHRFRWEELVSCLPDLATAAETRELEVEETVTMDPRLMHALGLSHPVTVDEVIDAMSSLLGSGKVTESPGRALMLGIVAGADLWCRDRLPEDIDGDDEIDEELDEPDQLWIRIANYALPPLQLLRVQAYIELHGEDLPTQVTVDGEMVDQLLRMTAARGAESLLGSCFDTEPTAG